MKAACEEDPESWFISLPKSRPSKATKNAIIRGVKQAVSACYDCPAMIPCGELGMESENLMWGIWGGMLPAERLTLAGKSKIDYTMNSVGYIEFKLKELVDASV